MQCSENAREHGPVTQLGVAGDLATKAVDIETVHLETLNHWTMRLRNYSMSLEMASPVTGQANIWNEPTLVEIEAYSPAYVAEVYAICQQCEKMLSRTPEAALQKSAFIRRSGFCWSVCDERRLAILTATTKCTIMEDKQKRDKDGAISKVRRFEAIREHLGLPKELIEFTTLNDKPKLDLRKDCLCWQVQYVDDYFSVYEWNRTPHKCLSDLFDTVYGKTSDETLDYIKQLTGSIPQTWEPELIAIVNANIDLGKLREEVKQRADNKDQPEELPKTP